LENKSNHQPVPNSRKFHVSVEIPWKWASQSFARVAARVETCVNGHSVMAMAIMSLLVHHTRSFDLVTLVSSVQC